MSIAMVGGERQERGHLTTGTARHPSLGHGGRHMARSPHCARQPQPVEGPTFQSKTGRTALEADCEELAMARPPAAAERPVVVVHRADAVDEEDEEEEEQPEVYRAASWYHDLLFARARAAQAL